MYASQFQFGTLKQTFGGQPDFKMPKSSASAPNKSVLHQNPLDISKTRTAITSQIQSYTCKQDMEIKILDTQFNNLRQDIPPKIKIMEQKHEITQGQLEAEAQRVQKIQMDDIYSLQREYSRINNDFEKFIKVEMENNTRPYMNELKQAKSQVSEINNSINTAFKENNDKYRECSNQIQSATKLIGSKCTKIKNQLNEMKPKLDKLESAINGINLSIDFDAPNPAPQNNIIKQLRKLALAASKIETVVIPKKISKSSKNLQKSLQELESMYNSKIDELSNIMAATTEASVNNYEIGQGLRDEIESTMNETYQLQTQVHTLDQNIRTRVVYAENEINAKSMTLRTELNDLPGDVYKIYDKTRNHVSDEIEIIHNQIQPAIKQVRNAYFGSSSESFNLSTDYAYDDFKTQDAFDRIKEMERKLQWCIDTIKEVNKTREKLLEIGASPEQTIARIEEMEMILVKNEKYLYDLDGEKAIHREKQVVKTVERIEKPLDDEKDKDLSDEQEEEEEKNESNAEKKAKTVPVSQEVTPKRKKREEKPKEVKPKEEEESQEPKEIVGEAKEENNISKSKRSNKKSKEAKPIEEDKKVDEIEEEEKDESKSKKQNNKSKETKLKDESKINTEEEEETKESKQNEEIKSEQKEEEEKKEIESKPKIRKNKSKVKKPKEEKENNKEKEEKKDSTSNIPIDSKEAEPKEESKNEPEKDTHEEEEKEVKKSKSKRSKSKPNSEENKEETEKPEDAKTTEEVKEPKPKESIEDYSPSKSHRKHRSKKTKKVEIAEAA